MAGATGARGYGLPGWPERPAHRNPANRDAASLPMPEKTPIYMDNHATTRIDDRVLEAMLPYLRERYGNAASRGHRFGWEAEEAVELARSEIVRMIGARTGAEIVFTSGATESNNLALKGVAHFYRDRGDHFITQKTEHKAVLDSARRLEREGFHVTYLDVDGSGLVDPDAVAAAITPRTLLVSIMLCNNEVGTIQPLAAIGTRTRERGVLLHCDAVQGAGRTELDVEAMGIDLLSLSAHKMYGPKGVGALYVRRSGPRVRLLPEIDGGGHERGMRSGTLNVPGIVGMGRAVGILREEGALESAAIAELRDSLHRGIVAAVSGVHLHGAEFLHRHPGNLNLSFDHVESEALMIALDDIAVSSGSACSSASVEPSYVLRAMGVAEAQADGSIRFGLGRFNTAEEVARTVAAVSRAVRRLRRLSAHSDG